MMDAKEYFDGLTGLDLSESYVIYLAGPIDHTTLDPDARHDELERAIDAVESEAVIFCPYCVQKVERSAPVVAMSRNLAAMMAADALVAFWAGAVQTPSFGTAIEVFAAGSAYPDRTVIVGTLGGGLVAGALRAKGIREVTSADEAVSLLRL